MCILLSSAPMVLHILAMDAVGLDCHFRAKVQKDMVKGTNANVQQELMRPPNLSPIPVDLEKAWEALKDALQVVKVVA